MAVSQIYSLKEANITLILKKVTALKTTAVNGH